MDGITVVLADPHRAVSEALAIYLEANREFRVLATAHNLPELLPTVRDHRPEIVVVSDALADRDEPHPARRIAHIAPGIRVLVLTEEGDSDRAVAALRAGASGWLLKTASGEEVKNALAMIADGEYAVSPSCVTPILRTLLGLQEPSGEGSRLARLTTRELEVLRLLADGLTPAAITERLGVATSTVRKHVQRILAKLEVHSVLEAAKLARQSAVR